MKDSKQMQVFENAWPIYHIYQYQRLCFPISADKTVICYAESLKSDMLGLNEGVPEGFHFGVCFVLNLCTLLCISTANYQLHSKFFAFNGT